MPKIMIVDDSVDTCNTLRRLLGRAGWEVLCVGEGKDAAERLRELQAEVVLLDVMMPEVDGFGVLAQIRSDPQTARTTVVMYSALADDQTRERAKAAGADGYLVKGVPFDIVQKRLAAYVGSSHHEPGEEGNSIPPH
jgi:CheY-like chemotaxis protein